MSFTRKRRDLILLIAGAVIASILISPVGAHVTSSVSHLWSDHLESKVKGLTYTKVRSDSKFLGAGETAANADKLDGVDSTSLLEAPESPRIVGNPGEPPFNDGDMVQPNPGDTCYWINYDVNNFSVATFFRDGDLVVHLDGMVKAVDGDQACGAHDEDQRIFRLPVGYRPSTRVVLTTIANDAIARVNVDSNGWVLVEGAFLQTGAETWISLSGLSFRAEQ
jgi:hypothetical protein